MGSSFPGGEMCMDGGRRRGGKKPAEHKASRQPQRGLGVAQLEKIRLHNQMMAAYRSGAGLQQDATTVRPHHQPPFAAASSSFQLPFGVTKCFEETERGIVAVHYYDLPPAFASSPPPLFAHDVRDSSGHRLGHPPAHPQQHYWMMSTSDGPTGSHGGAEELDLELRL